MKCGTTLPFPSRDTREKKGRKEREMETTPSLPSIPTQRRYERYDNHAQLLLAQTNSSSSSSCGFVIDTESKHRTSLSLSLGILRPSVLGSF
jgi:hypothetical protein